MNVIRFDSVCLWSENPDKLAEFYEKVLGLVVDQKINLPDDKGISFKLGEVLLFIGYHDKIKGESKDPYRIMPGFWVKSVKDVYDELSPKKIEFIREPSISPDGTYYAATIIDPEGNIIQFFSEKL
jgi:catechol 2,3-dioxygenase-like lactoylglutathione lyase family enzyme